MGEVGTKVKKMKWRQKDPNRISILYQYHHQSTNITENQTTMADQLTEEQIAEFKEAFSLFDKDGDGKFRRRSHLCVCGGIGPRQTDRMRQSEASIMAAGGGRHYVLCGGGASPQYRHSW